MTPAARVAAAIEVLDHWLDGQAAEAALLRWARHHRFAGSSDRAALRDHVFSALRRRLSAGALGGVGPGAPESGRRLMFGLLRLEGQDPATLFGAGPHAPAALSPEEAETPPPPEGPVALDCPAWAWPLFDSALGEKAAPTLRLLQARAPVFLRAALNKGPRAAAIAALAAEGIVARPHHLAETALEVIEGARKIAQSAAYLSGMVELQDAASQALVAALPLQPGMKVLDYCAGGGGKSLAMGSAQKLRLFAHDAAPQRLADLAPRAARAGLKVTVLETAALAKAAPFDLVLTDVPCSGSGAWRRAPEGKWRLTPESLSDLTKIQAEILDQAAPLVAPGGTLAYATCSLFAPENREQAAAFRRRAPHFTPLFERLWTPLEGGDGFFLALFRRDA